jgi:hypothetical protein
VQNDTIKLCKRGGRSNNDGSLSSKRKKIMHKRCTRERREIEGRMERFGLNTISG